VTVYYTAQDPFAAQKFEACERLLLLALSKPGQYVLKLGAGAGYCAVALAAP
jgi:protein-L-isoaspartate O-methyltransferase